MLRARSQKRRCGDLSGPLIEPDVIGHQAVHPPLVASVQVTGFVLPWDTALICWTNMGNYRAVSTWTDSSDVLENNSIPCCLVHLVWGVGPFQLKLPLFFIMLHWNHYVRILLLVPFSNLLKLFCIYVIRSVRDPDAWPGSCVGMYPIQQLAVWYFTSIQCAQLYLCVYIVWGSLISSQNEYIPVDIWSFLHFEVTPRNPFDCILFSDIQKEAVFFSATFNQYLILL